MAMYGSHDFRRRLRSLEQIAAHPAYRSLRELQLVPAGVEIENHNFGALVNHGNHILVGTRSASDDRVIALNYGVPGLDAGALSHSRVSWNLEFRADLKVAPID